MLRIGLLGKPNSGKSTFFSAATSKQVKIANYPFTTIEPNVGIAYVSFKCVCSELNVVDNPRNSMCIRGIRFVPVELWDVAGLVPGAWQGRGLGNKFLDDLRQADVLIHVVDASGRYDADGKDLGRPGLWDPLEDIRFLEEEIARWIWQILKKNWTKFARKVTVEKLNLADSLHQLLSGLKISREDIKSALESIDLDVSAPEQWTEDDLYEFAKTLRKISKPIVIVANKIDIPVSEENFRRMQKAGYDPVPASALAEFILNKYAEEGIIEYVRGDSKFEIIKPDKLNSNDKKLLSKIQELLDKWGSTGVQEALNKAVFEAKNYIAVYPVEDENKYTDKNGNVLPDVYLVPYGTTAKEFAAKIHTDLAKNFIYAVDAKTKKRLPADYILQHRDVIKIYAASRKR